MSAIAFPLVLALVAASEIPRQSSLVEQATEAYRNRRYREACKLFQQASDASPQDANILADLGLCLEKIGRPKAAVAVELKAAELGNRETRLHAYFNLYRLGHMVLADADELEGCKEIPSSGSCEEPLAACHYTDRGASGTGYEIVGQGVSFCPQGVAADGYPPGRSIGHLACFDIVTEYYQRSYCRAGDIGGAECGACGCDTAKNPAKCERAVEACLKTAESVEERECHVVFANACSHRIGAVCTKAGADKWQAEESGVGSSLPPPFDTFVEVDLYRALFDKSLDEPQQNLLKWLRDSRLVQRDGERHLLTLTVNSEHADLAVWSRNKNRLTLVSRIDLHSLLPNRVLGSVGFLRPWPERGDNDLFWVDTRDTASNQYESFIFKDYASPRVVLRRIHKGGWVPVTEDPSSCDDGKPDVDGAAEHIEFHKQCKGSYMLTEEAPTPPWVETWVWKDDHYERQGPESGPQRPGASAVQQ